MDCYDRPDRVASGVTGVFYSDGYLRVVSCGWCLNWKTTAVSQYTDYDFTSISETYATSADGVYDLAATGALEGHISLGKEDFGGENLKHLPACYLGVASDTPMELRVTTPDDEDYRYEARSSSADLRIQRVDPGQGFARQLVRSFVVQYGRFCFHAGVSQFCAGSVRPEDLTWLLSTLSRSQLVLQKSA